MSITWILTNEKILGRRGETRTRRISKRLHKGGSEAKVRLLPRNASINSR